VTDLATWLLEQIAADEQRALAVPESQRVWHHDVPADNDTPAALDLGGQGGSFIPVAGPHAADEGTTLWPAEADHIETWDPARVLAECDTKRWIIELAEEASGLDMSVDNDRRVGARDMQAEPLVGDLILRRMAGVYADRVGYRTEWRVEG
jgi:hypothetical protein